MTFRRSRRTSQRSRSSRKSKTLGAMRKEIRRTMKIESLEERRLLAVGPQLIGIQPNDGELLPFDSTDTRNVAPRELTFRFDRNQVIDVDTLDR